MKKNTICALTALSLLASVSSAFASCETNQKASAGELFLGLLTITTLPPVATTSTVICALSDDAELNRYFIEREATMVVEENQIFVPSFLGSYADQQGNGDLRAIAKDVLKNGVRQ